MAVPLICGQGVCMRSSGSSVYYGWYVLAASALSELLVMGATAYAAGLFVLPLQAEFHISRAAANSSVILLYLGAALFAPPIGRLMDRRSLRQLLCLGAVVLAASFAAIAASHALLVMALVLLLPCSIAFMLMGPMATQVLTTRWFNRHRGLALGIAAVATSGGGLIVVPLLSMAIQRFGWRQALLFEGLVVAAIIIALALLVIRDRPADKGLADHPETRQRDGSVQAEAPMLRLWQIIRSPIFWLPSLTLAAISGTSSAVVITLVPHAVKLGVAPASAALMISAFAVAAAITKVLAGILADHLRQRLLLIAGAACMTASWTALSLWEVPAALFASSALAGIALGLALPTSAALIAAGFGAAAMGRVLGWTYALTGIAAIVSVLFVGIMFDRMGAYHMAFQIFAAVLALVLLLTLLVAPERKPLADSRPA